MASEEWQHQFIDVDFDGRGKVERIELVGADGVRSEQFNGYADPPEDSDDRDDVLRVLNHQGQFRWHLAAVETLVSDPAGSTRRYWMRRSTD